MKNQYRIRNWSEYNAGLKLRGSLTFWLDEKVVGQWLVKNKTGKKGASQTYSDLAIATFSIFKSIYSLAGRQTEGFLKSLFSLMNLELPVPEHSTVSRRLSSVKVLLPVEKSSKPRHLVVDSTGIKVYGEGEWKTRQHGIGKRRTWRKLHLGVDESTGEIVSAVVTTNNYHDSQILGDILAGVEGEIKQVSADGAYDTKNCYEQIEQKQARAVIPPRKNAKIQQHGNCKSPPLPRDENLRRIREIGRKKWKQESGYHRRSLAETTMFRLKCIFGGKVASRTFENQATELFLQCIALNLMNQICRPESYVVVL